MTSSYINSDNKESYAYRRGVVLGLTMAEVLLILLFCLLIPMAVVYGSLREVKNVPEFFNEYDELEDFKKIHVLLEECNLVSKMKNERFMQLLSACLEPPKLEIAEGPTEDDELMDALKNLSESIKQENNFTDEETIKLLSEESFNKLIADLTGCFESTIGKSTNREYMLLLSDITDCFEEKMPDNEVEEVKEVEEVEEEEKTEWPPIIEISEASGYSFESGKSQLSESFKNLLKGNIVDIIVKHLMTYDANVVEVIGHTDMQPVVSTSVSNLDTNLQLFLSGSIENEQLSHSDNSGLGMARAVSVAKVLMEQLSKRTNFRDTIVLPYSGAQVISPNDTLSINSLQSNDGEQIESLANSERRRIEIRVRRSDKHEN